jgi:Mrp family chromosome partitioning ATPase
MGKVLETLKRRSQTAEPSLKKAVPRNGIASTPATVPAEPARPDSHLPSLDYLDTENLPFYEVPEKPAAVQPVRADKPHIAPVPAAPLTFTLPQSSTRTRGRYFRDQVVVVHQPESAAAAQYRHIREQVSALLRERDARSLLLLPLEQTGRIAVFSANLGAALAEKTQHPVLLVDAAQEAEGVASLFGLPASPGWEELLTGMPVAQVVQQSGFAWLDVIAAGRRLARATPSVWAKQAGKHLRSLERHYRLLVVTSPPWPHSPLASLLAQATDASCLVLEQPQVGQVTETTCIEALHGLGKSVLGSIVMTNE